MSSTVSARLHADLLEQNYALWKNDTRSVDATWAAFFEGFELGLAQPPKRESAPVPTGPIKLVQPKILYRFVDPELQKLSAGQKIMIRVGPENANRLKQVLRRLRRELLGQSVN